MKKVRDTVRGRKRSFFAAAIAMLMVFNLFPISAFAGTRYYLCNNAYQEDYGYITADNRIPIDGTNKLIGPGDEVVICFQSGYIKIDQKSEEYFYCNFDANNPSYAEYCSEYNAQLSTDELKKYNCANNTGANYVIGSDNNASEAGKYYRASYSGGSLILTTEPLYTVTFTSEFPDINIPSQHLPLNFKVTKPENPAKEGYIFNKWQYSAIDNEQTIWYDWDFANDELQGDLDLYAKWIPTYTVVYNSNGGTGTMNDQARTGGDQLSLTANAFTREGHTFSGWNTAADGSGDSVADGATGDLTSVGGATVTLYAQWTPNNTENNTAVTYTVTFDACGGSEVAAQTVNAGDKAVKPDNPVKAGYSFNGWYITVMGADSAETEVAYDFDSAVNSDITLRAKYVFNKDSLDDSDSKLDISEGFSDFTDDMKTAGFDTEEKVKNAMYQAIVEEIDEDEDVDEAERIIGSQLYDVDFSVSFDGGKTWEKVTEETFPEDGLSVLMDYPEGTDAKTNNFVVAHMFTHNMRGHKAGETETMVPEKTETGIKFKVSSLSPILVTWSLAAQEQTTETTDESANAAGDTNASRAPKTGGNVTALFVMILCLSAGAVLIGYAFYVRPKRR